MTNLDERFEVDRRTAAFEQHERGMLICLAGPGTGKTYSLLARSAALTARGFEPRTICYLTFIKEISSAFVADYIERFGEEAYEANAPRISTLHSFACRLLRNQGFRIGYDGDLYFASIADATEGGETVLADLLPLVRGPGCRTVPQLRDRCEEIKGAWRDGLDPARLPEPAASVLSGALALLRCFRLIDWDQTIPTAHSLLAGLEKAPEWISRIRHFFVDEFQDFNQAEQTLIQLLAVTAESMVIVGDDDQSLYSGRGGSPEGIRTLYAEKRHDRVSLVKCFRCPTNIVNPANTFQRAMSARPRPMTAASVGGRVLCYRFKSSKAEVAYIVEYVRARIKELPDNPRPKDGIVCLFPSKRVMACYFEMLAPSIPCVRRQAAKTAERLMFECALQLTIRPGQRFLERLILNDYRDLKPRHRKFIVRRILELDVAPSGACRSLLNDGAFGGKALVAAQSFVDTCATLSSMDTGSISRLLATRFGLPPEQVAQHVEVLLAADALDAGELVQFACDALLPATALPALDARAVLFLTMHGSKGLTKKTVVVPGLEEAWLPGQVAGDLLEERRRLFFVAISRATDNLLLTFPHNRGGKDSLNFNLPGRGEASSFIQAAGFNAVYHD